MIGKSAVKTPMVGKIHEYNTLIIGKNNVNSPIVGNIDEKN